MLSSYRSLQYSICDSIKKSAQIKTCIGFQITSKLGAKMINRHSQQIRQCHSHFFSSTRSEINIHRKHSYTTVRYKSTNKKPESTASPSKGSIENSNVVPQLSLWQKWIAPRPMPPRKTMKWYMEMALLCTVFSITGTSTMCKFYCIHCQIFSVFQVLNMLNIRMIYQKITNQLILVLFYTCLFSFLSKTNHSLFFDVAIF